MPYLNLDPDYFTNPKTRRLVGLLGPGADVLPIRLWCYMAKHHPEDGTLRGYTAQEIEGIIDWKGEIGHAVAALVRTGFLDKKRKTFVCHDWTEHEGHIKALKERARNAARKRWDGLGAASPEQCKEESEQCPGHAPAKPAMPAEPALPAEPSKPKKSKARPESIEEVRAYFIEIGEPDDADSWWDHFEGVGWRLGKSRSPMANWKATVRTWARNNRKWGNNGPSNRKSDQRSPGGRQVFTPEHNRRIADQVEAIERGGSGRDR